MTRRQKWLSVAAIALAGCATAAGVKLLHRADKDAIAEDETGRSLDCIKDVVLSSGSSCVLFQNGRVHCYGSGNLAGNGDIEAPPDRDPVQTSARFDALDSGSRNVCGVNRTDKSVWCWGDGIVTGFQQGRRPLPVRLDGLGTDNVQVAVALDRACAVKSDGSVWCQEFFPTAAKRVLDGARAVDAGNYFACAKMKSEEVWCWGANSSGQLGRGTLGDEALGVWGNEGPAPITGGGRELVSLRLRGSTACGLDAQHGVWCWGSADYSIFGDGRYFDGSNASELLVSTPKKLTLPMKVRDFDPGPLVLAEDGSVWSWGSAIGNPLLRERHGYVVDGARAEITLRPERLEALGTDNLRVFSGRHDCVQKRDRSLWCWGENSHWQASQKLVGTKDGLAQLLVRCPAD
jgi:alpha-tubulin suppressor-like RCC1 family protein